MENKMFNYSSRFIGLWAPRSSKPKKLIFNKFNHLNKYLESLLFFNKPLKWNSSCQRYSPRLDLPKTSRTVIY